MVWSLRVSTILSVNLSLAASICLVSRIKSDETAFTLLAISMALFSYWPIVRNELIFRCPLSPLLMVIVICPLTVIALISCSSVLLAILQLALHSFVVVLCPWILVKMQSLKRWAHLSLHYLSASVILRFFLCNSFCRQFSFISFCLFISA